MRAVLINHCHPARAHICAVRMREFAAALSARGHRIVLLTETLNREDSASDPQNLENLLACHDWGSPFVLACPPRPTAILTKVRNGQLPRFLRAPLIAWHHLRHGGMFHDWQAGTAAYLPALADAFRPQVVWGTLGNTDTWMIARTLAHQAKCPWVRDVKDLWMAPRILRPFVRPRFADAAATTALAAVRLKEWHDDRRPGDVIRSGVPATWLAARQTAATPADRLTISITGSIYDDRALRTIVTGIVAWLQRHPEVTIVLQYAGQEIARVTNAIRGASPRLRPEFPGYLASDALFALTCQADINLYVRGPPGIFHHKLIELLAARRPILCLPAETDEAVTLAAEHGGLLLSCADAQAVDAAVERVWTGVKPHLVPSGDALEGITWDAQARRLEALFARIGIDTTAASSTIRVGLDKARARE